MHFRMSSSSDKDLLFEKYNNTKIQKSDHVKKNNEEEDNWGNENNYGVEQTLRNANSQLKLNKELKAANSIKECSYITVTVTTKTRTTTSSTPTNLPVNVFAKEDTETLPKLAKIQGIHSLFFLNY